MRVKVYKMGDDKKPDTSEVMGEFEVKDIDRQEQRRLHHLNRSVFMGGFDPDRYTQCLDEIFKVSGLEWKDLDNYNQQDIDWILSQIYIAYQGLDQKKNGASGS